MLYMRFVYAYAYEDRRIEKGTYDKVDFLSRGGGGGIGQGVISRWD